MGHQSQMDRCPERGARRFVSKLPAYGVTSYDEGKREFRRQHVRAAFEFPCNERQTTLQTLPPDRRDDCEEVTVPEATAVQPSRLVPTAA